MSTLLAVKAPIPEQIVQVSDSEGFAVRGLTPFQVLALYRRHTGEMEPLFQRVVDGAKNDDTQAGDIEAVVLALASESPVILAEIIALASGGDPAADLLTHKLLTAGSIVPLLRGEDIGAATAMSAFDAATHLAAHLPFPTQIDALAKIGALTFTSEMPPGKFLALVTTLAQKVTSAMRNLPFPQA